MKYMSWLLLTGVAIYTSNATAACYSGWTESPSGTCWRFFSSPETFNSARASCRAIEAELVTLPTKMDTLFLRGFRSYYDQEGTRIWIGAHKYFGYWRWDGIHRGRVTFTDWNSGEPNNSGGSEECLEVGDGGRKGWNDLECSVMIPYICETENNLAAK